MPESIQQLNFNPEGRVLVGDYHDPATQSLIESIVAQREVGEAEFQSVIDGENLNDAYAQQVEGVHAYFSARGVNYKPIRIVTDTTMGKAYAAAGEQPAEDVESAQGRNVHGRSVVIENKPIQELFGDGYLLGLGLHEAAHSLSRDQVITTTREVTVSHEDGQTNTRVVLGGVASSGLIKADLRRETPNKPIGDFLEEAFADLTRVRGLRYLDRSNTMNGQPKTLEMGGVKVTVQPTKLETGEVEISPNSHTLPAEFATLAKTSEQGRNMVAIAPSNLAAYALELLDARVPGLYEDMEAGTRDSRIQAEAIRKIESIQPGLYRQLRSLEYTPQGFAQGLETVEAALS